MVGGLPASRGGRCWRGFDAGIRARLLGHSYEMNPEHYVEATDEMARSAVLALSPQPRSRVVDRVAVNPVNGVR